MHEKRLIVKVFTIFGKVSLGKSLWESLFGKVSSLMRGDTWGWGGWRPRDFPGFLETFQVLILKGANVAR